MRFPALFVLAGCAALAQPVLQNARVENRATGGFRETYGAILAAQRDPAWLGFSIAARDGQGTSCCWSNQCMGCGLEGRAEFGRQAAPTSPVRLEGSRRRYVLLRLAEGRVDKIRTFSEDCPLDAGGLTFYWLGDPKPGEIQPLLESLVRDGRDEALFVLAQNEEPASLDLLIETARNDQRPRMRSKALFWLAQRAGEKAVGVIRNSLENDPDSQVKRQAVFALSRLPKEQAVPLLIDVAKKSSQAEVRRQAIFWLGQSKDLRALDFLEEIIRR